MLKCKLYCKIQARLNKGSLCRNCYTNDYESNYILTDKYFCEDEEENDDIDETHSINSIHKSLNLSKTLDIMSNDRKVIDMLKEIMSKEKELESQLVAQFRDQIE